MKNKKAQKEKIYNRRSRKYNGKVKSIDTNTEREIWNSEWQEKEKTQKGELRTKEWKGTWVVYKKEENWQKTEKEKE